MRSVATILNKVFVQEFYRSNASFFLLVIGIAAGFMRSYEHIALAEFFVASPLFLLIPVAVWILYTIKVVRYDLELLNRDENEFLYAFGFLPMREQFLSAALALSAQLMPMIVYGIFLAAIAWKNGRALALGVTAAACVSLIILSSFRIVAALRRPHTEKRIWALTTYVNTRFTRPYFLYFPEWIIRREVVMLTGTKIFSCIVLLGVSQLYKYDSYDARLFGMATVIAFTANINLVWELHRFENVHFSLLRNLPIPFPSRIGHFLLTLGLLTIPEAGTVIKNLPADLNAADAASILVMGWSILVLFYGFLYLRDWGQEQMTPFIFFACIVHIVLILFRTPIVVLGLVNLVAGITMWKKRYYFFEPVAKGNS